MSVLTTLRSMDQSLIALALMTLLVILTVVSWHRNKAGFDLSQCIVDSVTGRISPEKVAYMTALAVSTWVIVALTIDDKITEGFLLTYLSIFVLGRAAAQGISAIKDIKTQAPTP